MWQSKFTPLKFFIILILVVILQSFFQNNQGLIGIVSGFLSYFTPFIYGVFFAVLLLPLSTFIENRLKVKRLLAVTLSLVVVTLVFIGLIVAIVPGLNDSFNEIMSRIPEYQITLEKWIEKSTEYLKNKNLIAGEMADNAEQLKKSIDEFIKSNFGTIKNIFFSLTNNMIELVVFLGKLGLGLIIAIFFILDKEYFTDLTHNTVYIFVGKDKAKSTIEFLDNVRKIFLNYLLGKTLSSLGVGIIAFVIMYFTNVPYAGLIAVLLGIGNMVPYIGAFVSLLIAGILVLIAAPQKLIYLGVAHIVSQQVEAFVLAPKIIGKTVGLNSFWVISGVLLGGAVAGPVGMIFGVPVIGVFKLIYKILLERKKGEINE
ncbi:MAG: AI-2E family transporter [Fusobacteriaceae bacterium]